MVDPTSYVGVPFAYGGRGPDTFDCYGLIIQIYKDQGIDILDYNSPSDQPTIAAIFASQLPLWKQVERGPGTVALMRLGRLISHCGYMLDDDRLIHTIESAGGVSIQKVDLWSHRVIGFYRYVG